MKNKSKIIIVIGIIALIILVGIFIYNFNNPDSNIKIGDADFSIPEGYSLNNNTGNLSISNGTKTINFICYDDNNVTKYVDLYIVSKESSNDTVNITTFEVNNLKVFKSTLSNASTVHYWFESNGKVYEISTLVNDPETNSVIMELLKSVEFS